MKETEEVFKLIKNSNYYISNMGNVKNDKGKVISKIKPTLLKSGHESYWAVAIRIIGRTKKTNRYIHKLMMDTFKSDEYLPILCRGTHKKAGRPSKESVVAAEYKTRRPRNVCFIDGNKNNLSLDNLKYSFDGKGDQRLKYTYSTENKYSNVFYLEETLISQIRKNTTEIDKQDNEIVIRFLKGNEQIIWTLFEKYKSFYWSRVCRTLGKSSKTVNKGRELSKGDVILDAQIKMIDKIKKGRFVGMGFKNWSISVVENYLQDFFIENKKTRPTPLT